MSFMDNYEPVADRIAKFWDKYPNGRLHTEIVLINETEVVIKASAFTDREDARPASIDFAQETRNSSSINKTSFIENCATSALGRCLATLNFQPKRDGKAVRPSKEEMKKVAAAQPVANDFSVRLAFLQAQQDLEGLRALYKEAQTLGANADTLANIKKAAEAIK